MTDPSPSPSPPPSFSFPPALQPSIIRSYQKDAYYLSELSAHLSSLARSAFGSRFLQAHSADLSLAASLAYYLFSTGGGAQTLGEEYVGSRMVAAQRGNNGSIAIRYAGRKRRAAFVLAHVLAPFLLARLYARLRRAVLVRHALREEASQRAAARALALGQGNSESTPHTRPSRLDRLTALVAAYLPPLDSLANTADGPLSHPASLHLMLFYLGGRYYSLAQRITRTRYIDVYPPPPGQHAHAHAPSYEVLGVLLGIQLALKALLAIKRVRARRRASARAQDTDAPAPATAQEHAVHLDGRKWVHRQAGGVPRPADDAHAHTHTDADSPDSPASLPPPGPALPLLFPYSRDSSSSSSSSAAPFPFRAGIPHPRARALPATARSSPPCSPRLLDSDDESSSSSSSSSLVAASARTSHAASASAALLRCTLCMDARAPQRGTSAVTECGHVFDWGCIVGWLGDGDGADGQGQAHGGGAPRRECPLCRREVEPSRVVPVYNL